jgi:DNA-binding transcriptional regulator YdaS (Cro superfamily)
MSDTSENPIIRAAIDIVGSQAKLADAVGVRQQTISKLLLGQREKISGEIAVGIHQATEGQVPKWKIRPDLFDAPARFEVA